MAFDNDKNSLWFLMSPDDPDKTQPHFLTQKEIDELFKTPWTDWTPNQEDRSEGPICTCGQAKTSFANIGHSSWCDIELAKEKP